MHRLGLQGRSILFCVVMLLITVGLLCTALSWRSYESSIRRVHQHAEMNARSIGYSAEPYVLLNDERGLQTVAEAAKSNPAVDMVLIVNRDAESLASYQSTDEDWFLRSVDLGALTSEQWGYDETFVRHEQGHFLVVVPIWSAASEIDIGLVEEEPADEPTAEGPIGFVMVAYSLGPVLADITSNILFSVLISIVIIVAAIAVTIVMVRQFVMPIQNLAFTAKAIAEGDLSKRAKSSGIGEVGVLAEAFNHMAEKVDEHAIHLEELVFDRTAALERSEARTRAILDTAADGIITIDESGAIESFNAAAEKIFGYSAAEVLGKNISMLMPEPYSSSHQTSIHNYLRTGQARIIGAGSEVVGLRKNGEVFPMDVAVSEVRFADRRMFTGIVRDITERKQSEEEQQKLVSLVENSRDFISLSSLSGEMLYLNAAGRQLVGLSQEDDVLSMALKDYYSQRSYTQIHETILPWVMSKESWTGETSLRNLRTGAEIAVQASFFLVLHPETGEPMCLATMQRDIREQKEQQAQVAKNLTELEKFNRLAVGRELRMVELKREINTLAQTVGQQPRYDLSFAE